MNDDGECDTVLPAPLIHDSQAWLIDGDPVHRATLPPSLPPSDPLHVPVSQQPMPPHRHTSPVVSPLLSPSTTPISRTNTPSSPALPSPPAHPAAPLWRRRAAMHDGEAAGASDWTDMNGAHRHTRLDKTAPRLLGGARADDDDDTTTVLQDSPAPSRTSRRGAAANSAVLGSRDTEELRSRRAALQLDIDTSKARIAEIDGQLARGACRTGATVADAAKRVHAGQRVEKKNPIATGVSARTDDEARSRGDDADAPERRGPTDAVERRGRGRGRHGVVPPRSSSSWGPRNRRRDRYDAARWRFLWAQTKPTARDWAEMEWMGYHVLTHTRRTSPCARPRAPGRPCGGTNHRRECPIRRRRGYTIPNEDRHTSSHRYHPCATLRELWTIVYLLLQHVPCSSSSTTTTTTRPPPTAQATGGTGVTNVRAPGALLRAQLTAACAEAPVRMLPEVMLPDVPMHAHLPWGHGTTAQATGACAWLPTHASSTRRRTAGRGGWSGRGEGGLRRTKHAPDAADICAVKAEAQDAVNAANVTDDDAVNAADDAVSAANVTDFVVSATVDAAGNTDAVNVDATPRGVTALPHERERPESVTVDTVRPRPSCVRSRLRCVVRRAQRLLRRESRRGLYRLHRSAETLCCWIVAMLAQVAVEEEGWGDGLHRDRKKAENTAHAVTRAPHANHTNSDDRSQHGSDNSDTTPYGDNRKDNDGIGIDYRNNTPCAVMKNPGRNRRDTMDRTNKDNNRATSSPIGSSDNASNRDSNGSRGSTRRCCANDTAQDEGVQADAQQQQRTSFSGLSATEATREEKGREAGSLDAERVSALEQERHEQLDYIELAEQEMHAITTLLYRLTAATNVTCDTPTTDDRAVGGSRASHTEEEQEQEQEQEEDSSNNSCTHGDWMSTSHWYTSHEEDKESESRSDPLYGGGESPPPHRPPPPSRGCGGATESAAQIHWLRHRLARQTEWADWARVRLGHARAAARAARAAQRVLRRRLAHSEACCSALQRLLSSGGGGGGGGADGRAAHCDARVGETHHEPPHAAAGHESDRWTDTRRLPVSRDVADRKAIRPADDAHDAPRHRWDSRPSPTATIPRRHDTKDGDGLIDPSRCIVDSHDDDDGGGGGGGGKNNNSHRDAEAHAGTAHPCATGSMREAMVRRCHRHLDDTTYRTAYDSLSCDYYALARHMAESGGWDGGGGGGEFADAVPTSRSLAAAVVIPVEEMTLAQLRHAVYTLRRDCAAMQAAGWRGALQTQELRTRARAERERRRLMHTIRLRALATLRASMTELVAQYRARQRESGQGDGEAMVR